MATHWIKDALAEVVAPTRCAGCERCGTVLCEWCIASVEVYATKKLCPRCAAPYGRLVCTDCVDSDFSFTGTVAYGLLDEALARAVVIYKDGFERRLGVVFGDLLGGRLTLRIAAGIDEPVDMVTSIPPTKRAFNRRGFDHVELVAARVARRLDVGYYKTLTRHPMRDLRPLSREERTYEVRKSYRLLNDTSGDDTHDDTRDDSTRGGTPSGLSLVDARVLLIDDVFTTGATLQGATELLLDAGAASVRCAVIARTW